MPHEDKNYDGSLVLDFRKRWRHVKTIYSWNSHLIWSLSVLSFCFPRNQTVQIQICLYFPSHERFFTSRHPNFFFLKKCVIINHFRVGSSCFITKLLKTSLTSFRASLTSPSGLSTSGRPQVGHNLYMPSLSFFSFFSLPLTPFPLLHSMHAQNYLFLGPTVEKNSHVVVRGKC